MKKYEIFDHTADIGIYAYGKNMADVFSHAALAMFSIITDLKNITPKTSVSIKMGGFDREDLLVRWLSELLYLFDFKHILFCAFEVEILNDKLLAATVRGENYDALRHTPKMEIKAVTYHGLNIARGEDGLWKATVVFDI